MDKVPEFHDDGSPKLRERIPKGLLDHGRASTHFVEWRQIGVFGFEVVGA